jgi:hypothetical protein
LSQSFWDQLTWYIQDQNYVISIPEGGGVVSLDQLKSTVSEAQVFFKVSHWEKLPE